jgi:hypothetical protein
MTVSVKLQISSGLGWSGPLKFYKWVYAVSANAKRAKNKSTNLASELGNTNGQLESGCPIGNVGLEIRGMDVIPVDGNLIDVAVGSAILEELSYPSKTIGSRGGARASESVTLIGERPDVTVPSRDGVGDGGIALGWFVDPGTRTVRIQWRDEKRVGFTYSFIP